MQRRPLWRRANGRLGAKDWADVLGHFVAWRALA